MTGFHEVRFPDKSPLARRAGRSSRPRWWAGHEKRNVNWAQARGRRDVASGLKKQAQVDELIAFFRARTRRITPIGRDLMPYAPVHLEADRFLGKYWHTRC